MGTVSQKTASFLDIMCTHYRLAELKQGNQSLTLQNESPGQSEFTSSGFGFIVTDIQRREAKYQMNPHEKKRQTSST